MARCLSNSRKSPLSKSLTASILTQNAVVNGGLDELHRRQSAATRGRGIQRELLHSSALPVYFLPSNFTYDSCHCTRYQIPFILPHASSLCNVQKSLPLVRRQNLIIRLKPEIVLCYSSNFRPFCSNTDSIRYDSDIESDENDGKIMCDEKEVNRVCKVIDETFAVDRNMEAVLDECGVKLTHELVLSVLERFKHARKPAFRFFVWANGRPGFAHDSTTYNAMMDILGKSRQFETMVSVLEEMGEKSLLTIETFSICIKAFAAAKERKKAVGIFDLMKKFKFKVGVETFNFLLDALGRANLGKEAQVLFDKLEDKFDPNLSTYTILLNGWCRVKNLMEAGRTWNLMVDSGFKPDIVAHNVMIEGLLKSRKKSDAMKLFEVMKSKGPLPNVRSYSMLINYLCKHRSIEDAVILLDEMLNSGCEPDTAVYTCLMTGFGRQKKMNLVFKILKEMKEKGCSPDGRTYNSLIKMMVSQKMPDDAIKVYKMMIRSGVRPSIHTYNMMMKSYFIARNYEMSCAVWEEMKGKGFCPDENSYIVFIGGLMRMGRSVEANKYLEEMRDKGMKAPRIDYEKFGGDSLRSYGRRGGVVEELGEKVKW